MYVGNALINWPIINHCALKGTKATPFRSLQSSFFLKKKFRARHKLEVAIKVFGIDCDGKIALDSGLSTGGFTDCLLQHVYGVDVGYGQVIIPSLKLSSSFQFICQFEEVATHCSTMTLNLIVPYSVSGG